MVSDTDVEVKCSLKVNLVSSRVNIIDPLGKTSLWKKIKRIIADIMKYKEKLLNPAKKREANKDGPIVDMNLLQKGEIAIIKLYLRRAFQREISTLENGRAISKQHLKIGPIFN